MPEERPAPTILDYPIEERIKRIEETFKLDPQVPLTLHGDRHFTLEFNNFAAKYVMKKCGLNVLKDPISTTTFENPDILGAVFRGALLTHHPELTEDDCDKMISIRHAPLIMLKLQQAITLFMPDVSETKKPSGKAEDPSKDPT